MIEVDGVTKRYRDTLAVDDLSFTVEPGKVTGFLGPNGAGKSTTMRVVLGLDRATSGRALVNGRAYGDSPRPLREVGALLDAGAVHPGRTGRAHLRVAARAGGIPGSRVEEVLETVGLQGAAHRRIRGYSLGMRQRLGIAAALLGDPAVVVFDEPVNGLDLDGVRWIRGLLRRLAAEGRTVLLSSHLLSEVQQVADRLVVIGRGRLIADTSTTELLSGLGAGTVHVRAAEAELLARALVERGRAVRGSGQELEVTGTTTDEVSEVAHALGVRLLHLSAGAQDLEQAYLALTGADVEHRSAVDARDGGAR